MTIDKTLLALALAGTLASCGSGSSTSDSASTVTVAADQKGKCMTSYPINGQNLIACAEVDQVTADELATFETIVCNNTQLPGTFTADALCPAEAVIDTCDVHIEALALDMKILYYADYNSVTAAMDCTQRKQQASQK